MDRRINSDFMHSIEYLLRKPILPFKLITEKILQMFQFKIIPKVIPYQQKRFNMQPTEDPRCKYCKDRGTLSHILRGLLR